MQATMNAGELAPDTIFISYRRDEAAYAAGWLHERMRRTWPGDGIFFDVDSIRAGLDFPERIGIALDRAHVVLVCVGPQWLSMEGADGRRRLDDPEDFVRREVEHGLARSARGECEVIPVFLDGLQGFRSVAGQPGTELPDAMSALATKQGAFIRRPLDTDADITRLIEQLAAILNVALPAHYAEPLPPLHQLPSPPVDFTGRAEELNELLAKVRTGGVMISGLQGIGGIGKTALAVKLAHELKPDYPDAQIFLDLKGVDSTEHSGVRQNPLSSTEVMWHVVRSFDPNLKRPDSDAEVESVYRTLLNGRSGEQSKRAILLFDNARDDKQVKPLLPPPSCLLLVTSRQRFDLPGMYRKDLDRMHPLEAEELLLVIAPRIGSHAAKIAELCGRLPLALELVARALNKGEDLSPEEVIERLEKPRSPLRWKKLQEVERSFNLSYELLSEDLQKLWRELAVFPETLDTAAAGAIWDLETIGAKDNLVELRGYSLLEWDNEQNRYRLHDLARDFADERLNDDERNSAQRRHAQHFWHVLAEANDLYLVGGEKVKEGLALYDCERKNVEAGLAWAEQRAEHDAEAAELCMEYPNAGRSIFVWRFSSREWIRWLKLQLVTARRLKRRDHEGYALGNLGLAYDDLGEPHKAIEFHEQSLIIKREIGDRCGECNALNNLGLVYDDLGELHKAIECYEQCLVINREVTNRRGEALSLGNLGNAYIDLGETHKAIEYYEQSLIIDREIGERQGEGCALGNLGNTYQRSGDSYQAIEYYEQALVIAREISDRRNEGKWLGNLGVARVNLGDARKATEYYEQALVIAREIGDRRREGLWLRNLANAHEKLGDPREAIKHCEQALAINRDVGDKQSERSVLTTLGFNLALCGEAQEAIKYCEQALVLDRELGDKKAEANDLSNLGIAFSMLGEKQKAMNCIEQAFAIAEVLGDKELKGGILEDRGDTCLKLGEVDKANQLFAEALKIYDDIGSSRAEGVRQKLPKLNCE